METTQLSEKDVLESSLRGLGSDMLLTGIALYVISTIYSLSIQSIIRDCIQDLMQITSREVSGL